MANQLQSPSLEQLLKEHNVDTVSMIASDFHGIARGKNLPGRRVLSNPNTSVNISSFMIMMDYAGHPEQPPADLPGWWPSWQEGYTDLRMVPDLATARIVPWQDRTALCICDYEHAEGKWPLDFMPRALVRRLTKRLADLGFDTKVSVELEWLLFRETEQSAFDKGYRDMIPLAPVAHCYSQTRAGRDAHIVQKFRHAIEDFGIAIDVWSAEAAPGCVEFNFPGRPALQAADEAFLFKHALREIAAQNDLFVTFLPKTTAAGFGNGVHINHSLWRGDTPAFYDESAPDKRSNILRQACAGELATLPAFTPLYCPTPTSYRRFTPYYSPGYLVGWAYDNKSVALRTVVATPEECRIEQRTGGSDANPYLAVAACLAGMVHGIENELEPPEPVTGDGYGNPDLVSIPDNLGEAISVFEQSELANSLLGEDFVRLYAHTRKMELEGYQQAVGDSPPVDISDWELMRYADTV